MAPTQELPDLGAAIGPIIAEAPEEHRPFVVAYAERLAARRYRAWASMATRPDHRDRLLECAEREEEIASRVEGLSADAVEIQTEFFAAHPEAEDAYASLFEGRPLSDQLRIQAAGERLGAATWRALAAGADGEARTVLASCAPLEEASAEVLEALVSEGVRASRDRVPR